jgi:glycerol-3-phosphate dehydrogenase
MAQEVVDKVISDLGTQRSRLFLPCCTASVPLPGAQDDDARMQLLKALLGVGMALEQAEHVLENYGNNGWEILEIMKRSPDEKRQICPFHPHVFAELTYGIEVEHVMTPEDWLYRRTSIAYAYACKGEKCYDCVAKKLCRASRQER